MDEETFERIEALFTKLSDEFSRKLDAQSDEFSRKLDAQSDEFSRKLDAQSDEFSGKLDAHSSEFQRLIGVQGEDFQHKLDLVVEGQQMLGERMDRMEAELKAEIRKVDQRVTAVAADLAAHRADTEAHHGVYRVKEG